MPDYVDPTPDAGAPPCTMVVFGATGDLTKRKLVPSLMNLAKDGLLDANFAVIGVAIQPMTDDEFRKKVEGDISELDPEVLNFDNWKWFKKRIYYIAGDFADPKTYAAIKAKLEEVDAKHQCKRNAFFYLATAPSFFGKVATKLGEAGLTEENGYFRRVIIEKPFGHDLASARALNAELRKTLKENQIYRIDHYLGKETVQNIMVLRFANAMFEPIWNSNYIDTCRSRWRRRSASSTAAATTTRRARCATWCRTTSCSSCRSSRWSRRFRSRPTRSATSKSKSYAR